MKIKKVFEPELARCYAAQLVEALDQIFSHGIMHRDFKPENILIDENLRLKVVSNKPFGYNKVSRLISGMRRNSMRAFTKSEFLASHSRNSPSCQCFRRKMSRMKS